MAMILPGGEAVGVVVDEYLGQSIDKGVMRGASVGAMRALRPSLLVRSLGRSSEAPFTVGFDRGFVGEDCGRGFGRAQVGVEQADEHEANGAADELSGDVAGR